MLVNVLKALGLVLRYTDLLKQNHLWRRDYLQILLSCADPLFNEFYHSHLIKLTPQVVGVCQLVLFLTLFPAYLFGVTCQIGFYLMVRKSLA